MAREFFYGKGNQGAGIDGNKGRWRNLTVEVGLITAIY
jgi:hypothetical protein